MGNEATIERGVIEALKTCYDPEIPVNIHELGLIYGVTVTPPGSVEICMTLTSPNCPAAQELPQQVEAAARTVPGVSQVKVGVTFDPPWHTGMMSEAAKLELGML